MPHPFLRRLAIVLEMIQFHHSLFALPFALSAMLVAARGWPTLATLFWIVVACVAARSMAMTYNRIADRDIDARNPRTRRRALPAGLVSVRFAWVFTAISAAAFVLAAGMLNTLCLALSPVAVAVLLGYSHWKRIGRGSHVLLGTALAIAPLGAWIAVTGSLRGLPVFLALGVVFWTAGFDIVYACQDTAFDRRHRLHSVPARVGVAGALRRSEWLHAGAALSFAGFAWTSRFGVFGWSGVAIVAAVLVLEHRIVSPDDLSRVGPAFFTFNAVVSVAFLVGCVLDVLV
ncbi:UbiA family prenyltransferase [Candidatus Sumerlaeota bacterium]|nr:UbiA family prenyltransferase [Candidatus Sumerlaeota bacterium]